MKFRILTLLTAALLACGDDDDTKTVRPQDAGATQPDAAAAPIDASTTPTTTPTQAALDVTWTLMKAGVTTTCTEAAVATIVVGHTPTSGLGSGGTGAA